MYNRTNRSLRISPTTHKIRAEDVDPKVDPITPELGVVNLRCLKSTCIEAYKQRFRHWQSTVKLGTANAVIGKQR